MPSDPVSLKGDKTQSWAVTVERNGEPVVTIASNCLGGRDLSEEDERVIRLAAQNLLSFVGEAPVPSPVSSTGAEQETFPVPLNAEQEAAAKLWAADDRLWTTQETVEFNLRTFARKILALRDSSPRTGWQTDRQLITACEDCGLPYREFPLDVVMPDADWLRIHPSGDGGLLCAGCIAKRVAALPDSIVLYARIVPNEAHEAFRTIKNVPWQDLRG